MLAPRQCLVLPDGGMKTMHMCQSVRGALRNWKAADWRGVMTDTETGRTLSPDEVREFLLDQLAQGHEVIPLGPPCEGFDYSGDGCPGHDPS